jgi:hypothetical protein
VLPAMVLSLILENKNGKKVEEENKKKRCENANLKLVYMQYQFFSRKLSIIQNSKRNWSISENCI